MKTIHILSIGAGNMGGILINRWAQYLPNAYKLTVITPKKHSFPDRIHAIHHISEISKPVDILVLAIKPQIVSTVLPDYYSVVKPDGIVISIMAGVPFETLHTYFPNTVNLVRIMPNVTAKTGHSNTALISNRANITNTKNPTVELLCKVFGEVTWVSSEDQLNRFTAVEGSGPGYLFYILDAMVQATKEMGFTEKEAYAMIIDLWNATLQMTLENKHHTLSELREMVTSKKGSTEAGLKILMKDDFLQKLFLQTYTAAYAQNITLSK